MNLSTKLLWFTSRMVLILSFTPVYQTILFAPFLANASQNFVDPWSSWLELNGRSDAFPYGPLMYAILGIASLFAKFLVLIGLSVEPITIVTVCISGLLLIIDYFSTVFVFDRFNQNKLSQLVLVFAPLPLYVTYIYGQNDIIPSLIVLLIFSAAISGNWKKVGVFSGLGVCIKFSLILIVPFVLVFLITTKQVQNLLKFVSHFLPTSLIALLPLLWSPGYYEMAIRSPEFMNSLDFSVQIGLQNVYLMPVGYLVTLLVFLSLPRMTPKILSAYVALSFITVASLQSRSIGWYLWGYLLVLPLILRMRIRIIALFFIWQCSLVVFYGYRSGEIGFRYLSDVEWDANPILESLLFTISIVLCFVLILKLVVELDDHLDPFRLGRKPISIGIAGDSGVGKDTLVNAISKLLTDVRITVSLGDDYHIAERKDLIWKNRTHLNVSANDISRWNRDVGLILNRKKASARHYDHSNGKFTASRKIEAGDLVILNGLHSLLLPEVEKFDLKVFLSMEESMRIEMKIKRDEVKRGYVDRKTLIESINQRVPDFRRYVLNQREYADLSIEIVGLEDGEKSKIHYRIQAQDEALLLEIYRVFQSFDADLAHILVEDGGKSILLLYPEVFTANIYELTLRRLIPNLDDLIPNPNFELKDSSILVVVVMAYSSRRREYLHGR
jgi:uridine kinase